MDLSQTNHLKAYGVIFNHIAQNESGMWLLNYRGGSFLTTSSSNIVREARLRNVRVETISASEAQAILRRWRIPEPIWRWSTWRRFPLLRSILPRGHHPGMTL